MSDNTAEISVEDASEVEKPKMEIMENDGDGEPAEGEEKGENEASDEDSVEQLDSATLLKTSKAILSLFMQYNMQSTDILKSIRQHDTVNQIGPNNFTGKDLFDALQIEKRAWITEEETETIAQFFDIESTNKFQYKHMIDLLSNNDALNVFAREAVITTPIVYFAIYRAIEEHIHSVHSALAAKILAEALKVEKKDNKSIKRQFCEFKQFSAKFSHIFGKMQKAKPLMFKEFIVSLQTEHGEISNECISALVASSYLQNCTDTEQVMQFKNRHH